jgi:hypothetical protein
MAAIGPISACCHRQLWVGNGPSLPTGPDFLCSVSAYCRVSSEVQATPDKWCSRLLKMTKAPLCGAFSFSKLFIKTKFSDTLAKSRFENLRGGNHVDDKEPAFGIRCGIARTTS